MKTGDDLVSSSYAEDTLLGDGFGYLTGLTYGLFKTDDGLRDDTLLLLGERYYIYSCEDAGCSTAISH